MDPQATQLRWRAGELRRAAAAIERSPVMTLEAHVNGATVTGPRFEWLGERLSAHQHDLYAAADGLRWAAYRLEQLADELDLAARLAAIAGGGAVA